MGNVLRLAIVDPDDTSREALKNLLLGMDTVWLEAECSKYEYFTDVVDQSNPDVGVVTIDDDPDKAIRLIEQLRAASGLGTRTRRMGDDVERARKAVSGRIRAAIDRIAESDPSLSDHLRETIKTGRYCRYD